jgi:ribosomal protein S18 acetylase RimI-like enzyme
MNPTYRIEPMVIEDYDEVLRLWQTTDGMGLGESDSKEAIAFYLERNPGMSLVARDGKEIIATVLCGCDGRRGYLYHLAVAKSHRKKGIGKKLVDICIARLQELGIHRCNVLVFADNADGESFWKHHEWEKRTNVVMFQKLISQSKENRCC